MEIIDYINKPVTEWTEAELRHARSQHAGIINEAHMPLIDARLDAIEANKRLINERSRALVSFADTTSKPAQSVDVRSVKHSAIDATADKKGGPAITVAGVVAAYEFANNHPELTEHLPQIPPIIWVAIVLMGLAVWSMQFLVRLKQKWSEEH